MNGRIDTFANRLSKALLIRNIKPVDLAEKTGISKSKISSYMSGRYKAKQDGVYLLSKALDVDPGWLMGYDVSMDGRTKITEIDVINLSTNEIIKKIPYLYRTDIADEDPNNFFAIYASDNSMAPLLDVGDIAIIKKYKEFTNRKTYLLKIKNGNPIIRKVIKNDDEKIELQAMNMWNFPTQKDLNMDDIEILGEVIKVENKSAFK